jgi:hypothetical protein
VSKSARRMKRGDQIPEVVPLGKYLCLLSYNISADKVMKDFLLPARGPVGRPSV